MLGWPAYGPESERWMLRMAAARSESLVHERLPFEISAEGGECAEKRERIQRPMALAAAEQSQNQNTPDRQHNRQVPAIRRIGFVVSVLGRAEGTPSAGRSRIVIINAHALA